MNLFSGIRAPMAFSFGIRALVVNLTLFSGISAPMVSGIRAPLVLELGPSPFLELGPVTSWIHIIFILEKLEMQFLLRYKVPAKSYPYSKFDFSSLIDFIRSLVSLNP